MNVLHIGRGQRLSAWAWVIAHGEYCDEKKKFYLEKHTDFTQNVVDLCHFVGGFKGTWGADDDECYELILRKVDIIYVSRRDQSSAGHD